MALKARWICCNHDYAAYSDFLIRRGINIKLCRKQSYVISAAPDMVAINVKDHNVPGSTCLPISGQK